MDGWWSNYDQHRYLLSALGFSRGDLSPDAHWYLPAYPALASLFVHVLPADPFFLLDLFCLLVSLWLSAGLGAALAPDWRSARLAGLLAFLGCAVLPPVSLAAWVMPWSSTLAAPLTLGCLCATLAGLNRPQRRSPPVLAGFAGAAVAGCRPADAVLLLGCAALIGGIGALRSRGIRPALLVWAPLFGLGVVLGVLPNLVLFAAVWGLHQSPYMVSSAMVGFDPHLLALHWVEIMISPRPMVPDGAGLVQRLPFIGVGLIGLIGALLVRNGTSLRHALVALAVGSSIALYLSYRDLHAPGLWQYSNYHYFKWTFGLLGFYAVLLLKRVAEPHRRRLLWLLPAAVLLFGWRVVPHPLDAPRGAVRDDRDFSIPVPPLGLRDAVVVPATGPYETIYFGRHDVSINNRSLPPITHFKALPITGGLMVMPLRAWPAGSLSVRFVSGIRLLRTTPPFLAHLSLRPGLPCWFGLRQAGCDTDGLLPAPALPEATPVALDAGIPPQLGSGWSTQDPTGRWTLGHDASLRFRVDPHATGPIRITLSASPLWQPGMPPAVIDLAVTGQKPARRLLPDGSTRDISLDVPAAARGTDGTVELWIETAVPHAPSDVFPGSRDMRPLGLFVRTVRWNTLP